MLVWNDKELKQLGALKHGTRHRWSGRSIVGDLLELEHWSAAIWMPNGLDRSCEATIYPVLDKPPPPELVTTEERSGTAWIDRAKPRSILCWTSHQHRGAWGDEGAGPTADKSVGFQVSFMIGLAGRKETCHMILITSVEV